MIVSENEYKILSLMWREKRPITRADILKGTEGRNWNPASIHLILNSMISKGVIKITDEAKKYGRTYEPTINKDQYLLETLKAAFPGEDVTQVLKDCTKLLRRMK